MELVDNHLISFQKLCPQWHFTEPNQLSIYGFSDGGISGKIFNPNQEHLLFKILNLVFHKVITHLLYSSHLQLAHKTNFINSDGFNLLLNSIKSSKLIHHQTFKTSDQFQSYKTTSLTLLHTRLEYFKTDHSINNSQSLSHFLYKNSNQNDGLKKSMKVIKIILKNKIILYLYFIKSQFI